MYSLWGWLAVVIVTAVIAGGVASILARQRSRLLQQELAQHEQVRADLIERLQAQERLTHQWQTDYSKLQAEYAAVRAELSAKLESAAEKQQLLERSEERLKQELDRKSTRLNSSHVRISYAVFCLKKKKKKNKKKKIKKKKKKKNKKSYIKYKSNTKTLKKTMQKQYPYKLINVERLKQNTQR